METKSKRTQNTDHLFDREKEKRRGQPTTPLRVNQQDIEETNELKYLGIW